MPSFGFMKYPQRKTPSSEEVGTALLQQGQGPGSMAPDPGAEFSPGRMAPPVDPSVADAAMRAQGATQMGAPGQIDDAAGAPDTGMHSANALNVAVGEALTRTGGGYTTSLNPFKPRDRTRLNLQQLGLSEAEADLLIRTGGA